MAKQDLELARDVRAALDEGAWAEREIVRNQRESERIRARAEEERSLAILARAEREAVLTDLRGRRSLQEQALRELEEAARRVERIVAGLERERLGDDAPYPDDGGATFASRKGRLPWPAEGRIASGFGRQRHPRFGTWTENPGIDIAAPKGSRITAVHGGRVEYADALPGYGRCLIVGHGDGYYTLYAHADEVWVTRGETVQAGQALGTVGESGSLVGPALHFEVRKGSSALDPGAWLRR
jgi:murein DD-endopeptidase MepM/ murein hydrolase activator NlpD